MGGAACPAPCRGRHSPHRTSVELGRTMPVFVFETENPIDGDTMGGILNGVGRVLMNLGIKPSLVLEIGQCDECHGEIMCENHLAALSGQMDPSCSS